MVYLAALRHLQIASSSCTPRPEWPFLQPEYVLRGIKRSNSNSPARSCLPITATQLKTVWAPISGQNVEQSLWWATASLAFFGFLRSGEITSSPGKPPTISVAGVAVDSHASPSVLKVVLSHSKTDPFQERRSRGGAEGAGAPPTFYTGGAEPPKFINSYHVCVINMGLDSISLGSCLCLQLSKKCRWMARSVQAVS